MKNFIIGKAGGDRKAHIYIPCDYIFHGCLRLCDGYEPVSKVRKSNKGMCKFCQDIQSSKRAISEYITESCYGQGEFYQWCEFCKKRFKCLTMGRDEKFWQERKYWQDRVK